MIRKIHSWKTGIILALVAFSMQGCLWFGGNNSNFKATDTGQHQVSTNQNQSLFAGKIYFTIDHRLWVLDGKTNGLTPLTQPGKDVRDPAVSPDGKWVAFTVRPSKNYSNIVYMSLSGGPQHVVRDGNGKWYFVAGVDTPKNTFSWNAQPHWAADSTHLLFLSDFEKEDWYFKTFAISHYDAPVLDMQVYSLSIKDASVTAKATTGSSAIKSVALAYLADGGNSDPSYRPGHGDQIIYTHYAYDDTHTKQVIQLFMEDPNEISRHVRGYYYPGYPGFDPGIAITPPDTQAIQPSFSPDGSAIAYVQRQSSGQMSLRIMPTPEGITKNPNDPKVIKQALLPYKKSSTLLTQEFVSQPAWSPDGKSMIYLTYNNQDYDLWLAKLKVDPTTGKYSIAGSPTQLTSGGIDGDSHPSWTP